MLRFVSVLVCLESSYFIATLCQWHCCYMLARSLSFLAVGEQLYSSISSSPDVDADMPEQLKCVPFASGDQRHSAASSGKVILHASILVVCSVEDLPSPYVSELRVLHRYLAFFLFGGKSVLRKTCSLVAWNIAVVHFRIFFQFHHDHWLPKWADCVCLKSEVRTTQFTCACWRSCSRLLLACETLQGREDWQKTGYNLSAKLILVLPSRSDKLLLQFFHNLLVDFYCFSVQTFRLSNPSTGAQYHVGVLEFTAKEKDEVIVPQSIMQHLGLNYGELLVDFICALRSLCLVEDV